MMERTEQDQVSSPFDDATSHSAGDAARLVHETSGTEVRLPRHQNERNRNAHLMTGASSHVPLLSAGQVLDQIFASTAAAHAVSNSNVDPLVAGPDMSSQYGLSLTENGTASLADTPFDEITADVANFSLSEEPGSNPPPVSRPQRSTDPLIARDRLRENANQQPTTSPVGEDALLASIPSLIDSDVSTLSSGYRQPSSPHPTSHTPLAAKPGNAKAELQLYYDHHEKVKLLKENFVAWKDRSNGDHCLFWTCFFVSPEGFTVPAGKLVECEEAKHQKMGGLNWYRDKKVAMRAAAGRTMDCLDRDSLSSAVLRHCQEEPTALPMLENLPHKYPEAVELIEEARERMGQLFGHQFTCATERAASNATAPHLGDEFRGRREMGDERSDAMAGTASHSQFLTPGFLASTQTAPWNPSAIFGADSSSSCAPSPTRTEISSESEWLFVEQVALETSNVSVTDESNQNAPTAAATPQAKPVHAKDELHKYYDQKAFAKLSKKNFVTWKDESRGDHLPHWTCCVVTPGGHVVPGLHWYGDKMEAMCAAAGRTMDCLIFEETGRPRPSLALRHCFEEPASLPLLEALPLDYPQAVQRIRQLQRGDQT